MRDRTGLNFTSAPRLSHVDFASLDAKTTRSVLNVSDHLPRKKVICVFQDN